MKIGFLTKYNAREINQPVGEELYAQSLCRELLKLNDVTSAEVFSVRSLPRQKLDVLIHLNDTPPDSSAYKHVLYMQNFYPTGSDLRLIQLHQFNYNGYIFFSRRLLAIHKNLGHDGIFLPLAADTEIFKPTKKIAEHQFDVVYVGSDIKSYERTMQYIYPAIKFNFGLFGNWNQSWHSRDYKEKLRELSKGSVSRETAASLFSNSKISLNFTGDDSVTWDAMNLRFYEVLACKGFLLSDKIPSAQHQLEGCAVFTDGGQDLIDKIEYYLTRPKEREEIAERGYRYVINNATIQMRAAELFNYLQKVMNMPSLKRR